MGGGRQRAGRHRSHHASITLTLLSSPPAPSRHPTPSADMHPLHVISAPLPSFLRRQEPPSPPPFPSPIHPSPLSGGRLGGGWKATSQPPSLAPRLDHPQPHPSFLIPPPPPATQPPAQTCAPFTSSPHPSAPPRPLPSFLRRQEPRARHRFAPARADPEPSGQRSRSCEDPYRSTARSSLSGFFPSGSVKKLQKQVPSKSTSPLITGSQTQIVSSLLAGWQGQ